MCLPSRQRGSHGCPYVASPPTWEGVSSVASLLRILTEPRGIDWESTVGQALGKVSTESVQRGREGPRHCHTLARLQGTSTKGLSISCLVLTHPASQGRGTRAPVFSQPPSSLSHRTSSTSMAMSLRFLPGFLPRSLEPLPYIPSSLGF